MENKNEGKITAGTHVSYWTESIAPPTGQNTVKENLEADVIIVGGGLAGLSVAYCLTMAGKKIILVEDGLIGSGETGRTTAHLVTALDNRYYKLEKIFGAEKTKLLAQSHAKAIDFVERTVQREKIDCDFERLNGYLFLHPSDKEESLKNELEAALRAGLDVTESEEVLLDTGKCLCFHGQAQFHPMKYLKGLCSAIEKRGGRIFTETHAAEIDNEGIKTSEGYTIKAKNVVVATNSPVNYKYAMHLKQYAYRTYVIGCLIKKNSLPKALWWDTGDFERDEKVPPYHYARITLYNEQHDLLIVGGEDHPIADTSKTHVAEEHRYKLLEEWTRKHFNIESVVYNWSGQVLEPMDGVAFIGSNIMGPENVYIVTGDSGNGMTHCTIAGMLITDLILEKENPWEDLYRPERFTLKASKPFFKEVIGSLMAMLKKEPEHKDNIMLSSIQRGEAKQVELNGEKCGIYRDEDDRMHIVSTVCTHLKCSVKWNNDEKSWDCPCHGSRFTYHGKVINGPANADLPSYSEKEIMVEIKK
jgi:glycine/D-amino acid oxidase-like deaminating enzyme/nitrite reductase/ring-hydroxylating ferredoxin subunit